MVQIILVIVSIIIIFYIKLTSETSQSKNKFDIILDKEIEKNKKILFLDLKERKFIDKVIEENNYSEFNIYEVEESNKKYENIKSDTLDRAKDDKKDQFIQMLNEGYCEVEICKVLNIGRGEFLLLKSLYKE